jgi:hypothetical protein
MHIFRFVLDLTSNSVLVRTDDELKFPPCRARSQGRNTFDALVDIEQCAGGAGGSSGAVSGQPLGKLRGADWSAVVWRVDLDEFGVSGGTARVSRFSASAS